MKAPFFSLSVPTIDKAASLGVAALSSLVVVACGSGKDNVTSSWSASAVQKYTRLGQKRAQKAISDLLGAGVLSVAAGSKKTKPRYKIKRDKNAAEIWLPECFVTGLEGEEVSVLERLRAAGGVTYLHLLLRLYEHQNMQEHYGLPSNLIGQKAKVANTLTRGRNIVTAFNWDGPPTHLSPSPPFGDFKSPDGKDHNCWKYIHHLQRLGAIDLIPVVFESAEWDALPLWVAPYGQTGEVFEASIMALQSDRARELAEEGLTNFEDHYDLLAIWPDTYPNAIVRGIYRLRYRPHTALNRAWASMAKYMANSLEASINCTDWPITKKRQNFA